MFNNPFPNAFGLDIGDLSIKLVQLDNVSRRYRGASFNVSTVRSIKLPYGLIVNGELQQPEQVRNYIKKLLQGKKHEQKPIKSPWVVASLPETQSFLKQITLSKSQDDIIEDDIMIEAKKHIPFTEEDDYYLDWQVLPSDDINAAKTYVLIGAVPKTIADSYTYLLESLNLGVMALETEAISIARAMVTAYKEYRAEARALLDIGATKSSLIIYDHDRLQFSTSLPFSGELITTAISQSLKISYEEAEKMKIENGLGYNKQKKSWGEMSDLITQFSDDIRKTIYFYYSHFEDTNRVTHITMCGGGAHMKHLEKALSLQLKIECQPGKVWKNLFTKKDIPVPENKSLFYATGIGLALRAADNPLMKQDTL